MTLIVFSKSRKFRFLLALSVCVILSESVAAAITAGTTTTTSTTPLASVSNPDSSSSKNKESFKRLNKESVNKRETNTIDSHGSSSTAQSKSYDPPPEFYRGPGSYPTPTAAYNKYDSSLSKPISFPDTNARDKYSAPDASIPITNAYNKWQVLKGTQAAGTINYNNKLQDRISVGHYGSPDHGSIGYGGAGSYDSHSYVDAPHHVDYVYTNPSPYPAHDYHHAPPQHGDSIPFDVYGSKGHGHYSGAGGEYSYSSYPSEHLHEQATHKGPPDYSRKVLLAKSFLIPLASAAVLGIAAALVSNPLLLQLGTVSAVGPAVVGKRKRRDLAASTKQLQASKAHVSAYRGYRKRHFAANTLAT